MSSIKLQMRQSQGLSLTPQLMQAIQLLQLSQHELEQFVDEEIRNNPLLERRETKTDDTSHMLAAEESVNWHESRSETDSVQISDRLDTSLENIFPDDPGQREALSPILTMQWKSVSGSSPGQSKMEGQSFDGFDLDGLAAAPPTLREHVLGQIAFAFAESGQRFAATHLADCLDDSGYLIESVETVATRLGVSPEYMETVLFVCQGFEPVGLFARNLSECLAIQLRSRNRFDPAMQALTENLDLLAKRDFGRLRQICGVENDDLLEMLDEIRALDPKPGSKFSGDTTHMVVPDILVRPSADGGWTIELNPEALPRILVDRVYHAKISAGSLTPAEKMFMADCLQRANWLTHSLDQRARTVLKAASEIVRHQDSFLLNGISHLKPLTLRNIAEAIGMHESTVSRATANKTMTTPRGLFELRYFLTPSIGSVEGGEAYSAKSIRHRIRKLIDGETAGHVLSDDSIVAILQSEDIDIARRTVAKYRESMNILSSVQRRREKKAMARSSASDLKTSRNRLS